MSETKWHGLGLMIASVLMLALAGCARDDDDAEVVEAPAAKPAAISDYEIWALDQGTHKLWIYDAALEELARIDLGERGIRTPHMIDFTSDYRYAFIASTGSGDVTVMRTADREIVDIIETGPRTHMAGVSPDDARVLVDVIGSPDEHRDGEVVEILLDLDAERFEIGRRLTLADDALLSEREAQFNDFAPICHEYTRDGQHAWITLGPGLDDGGLLVLDVDAFEVVEAWGPEQLQVNCGTMPTADGKHMFVNGGGHGVGKWYVFDTRSLEKVHEADSRGEDAHGVWLTPDGREMWMVNRITDNAIIIDAESFEIIDEMDYVGTTPDIMGMSPDGSHAYITLRGPNPVSAPHVAVGETPGFAVVDVRERRLVGVIEPDEGNEDSDFHGIGVRPLK